MFQQAAELPAQPGNAEPAETEAVEPTAEEAGEKWWTIRPEKSVYWKIVFALVRKYGSNSLPKMVQTA